jgi:hypothetical protein
VVEWLITTFGLPAVPVLERLRTKYGVV